MASNQEREGQVATSNKRKRDEADEGNQNDDSDDVSGENEANDQSSENEDKGEDRFSMDSSDSFGDDDSDGDNLDEYDSNSSELSEDEEDQINSSPEENNIDKKPVRSLVEICLPLAAEYGNPASIENRLPGHLRERLTKLQQESMRKLRNIKDILNHVKAHRPIDFRHLMTPLRSRDIPPCVAMFYFKEARDLVKRWAVVGTPKRSYPPDREITFVMHIRKYNRSFFSSRCNDFSVIDILDPEILSSRAHYLFQVEIEKSREHHLDPFNLTLEHVKTGYKFDLVTGCQPVIYLGSDHSCKGAHKQAMDDAVELVDFILSDRLLGGSPGDEYYTEVGYPQHIDMYDDERPDINDFL